MDLRFIKLMVESYYNDSSVVKGIYSSKKEFVDDIYTEIESILSSCRAEDPNLYFELYTNYDKGQQQKILYSLIEQSLYDRYPDQFPIYETDYDKLYDAMLNESLSGIAASALGAGLGGLLLAFVSQTTPFNKVKWGIMTKFQQLNEKIHKFITNLTKTGRVKAAITFNNANECYQKCNIHDQKDISKFIGGSYRSRFGKDNAFNLETAKGREQAHCLTTCYLKWSLNQVSTLLQSYLTCLRQTGDRGVDLNDIKLALTTAPSSHICNPYYELLRQHRDNFEEVLDVICKDSIEKEEFERLYQDALNKAASNSGKVNTTPGYKLDKEAFSRRR